MNNKYFEELTDYVMKHKAPAVLNKQQLFVGNRTFSIDSVAHQTRLEVIEQLKNNEKYRNHCEEKKTEYGGIEMEFWKEVVPNARSDFT